MDRHLVWVALVLVATLVTGCGRPAPATAPIATAPAAVPAELAFASPPAPDCEGDPSPADIEAFFADRTAGWAAGDLLDRVALGDGRYLWIFGDTFMGAVDESGALGPDYRMVHSSAVLQRGTCFEPLATDDGWAWVSWPPDGTWLWPQEAAVDNGFLHVFLVRVRHRPDARPGLDFEVVGGAMAVFALDDLGDPVLVVDGTPTIGTHPFGWGLVRDDDHHYLYAHVYGDGSYVARAPVGELATYSAWRYWDGTGWQPEPVRAEPVHRSPLRVDEASPGRYRALSLAFGADAVVELEAPDPVGPFAVVASHPIGAIVDPATSWAYLPLAIETTEGEVLAVNVLPWDTTAIVRDVYTYGPRVVGSTPLG